LEVISIKINAIENILLVIYNVFQIENPPPTALKRDNRKGSYLLNMPILYIKHA